MSALLRFVRRVRAIVTHDVSERELSREIDVHLALLEDQYRGRGMTPDEARAAARRALGSVAHAQDLHRDARSFAWLEDARLDVRFAVRMLVRSPGFAAVTILTMALSVGATTSLFSLAYGVLMRPLPWPESTRLVRLQETRGGQGSRVPWTISNAAYLAWRDHPSTIEDVGGWTRSRRMTVSSDRESERLTIGVITPSLLNVLRARPAMGRAFLDDEGKRGQPKVVLLSYGLWQRRFGGRADVLGATVRLDREPYTVIGVMPRSFAFPTPESEAWVPFAVGPVKQGSVISLMVFSAIARLRPGVSPEQASAEATSRTRGAPDLEMTAVALFGNNGAPGLSARSALDVMTAEVRPALLILLAAVGLLFVASTASLVVLQLSRVARRRREIAVRTAIGAGSTRLIRQWLVESAMLGMAGTAAGLLAAMFLHRVLPGVLPSGFPRLADVQLDWRVTLFACAVACLVSLACGMVPAFRGRRDQIVNGLREGPATTPAVTRTAAARVRFVFMAAQVAVACILLVGASLLMRSFSALTAVDRGFDPRGTLTMRIPVPGQWMFAKNRDMLDRLRARLTSEPGVTDVAYGNALPFVSVGTYSGLNTALPRDPGTKVDVQMTQHAVSTEYFRAMGLRVIQGRSFGDSDTESSPRVIVVNRTFANRYLGDRPVGERLDLNTPNQKIWEVVGVVEDMRQGNVNDQGSTFGGLLDPPQGEVFFVDRQWPFGIADLIVVVRTTADPAALAPRARAVVQAENPLLPVDSVMTMEDRVAESLAGPRSYAVFLGGFALCAVLISGVGLFGVLSYTMSQRVREIGLRTALGAQRADVLALVGRQAMAMTMGGVLVGIATSFFLSQSLSKLLYGISTRDAVTFLVVPLVLVVVSLVACIAPAWRAMRIDPLAALRS